MKKNFVFLMLLAGIRINSAENEKDFNLNFQQHEYKVLYERIELVRYNKDYVKEMSFKTFKYNRTQAATNWTFTLNVDVGNDLVWILQAYKFMSNEYREFPLHFAANFCKALAANVAGSQILKACGNFTGCPLVKGRKYHSCNFHPDEEKCPPFIPSGSYKAEFTALYFSNEIFVINAFATITRPIV